MTRPPSARALTVLARWFLGTVLITWRYLWDTTPLHRGGERQGDASDRPPHLPPKLSTIGCSWRRTAAVPCSTASSGTHRRGEIDACQLIERVCHDFKNFVPSEVVGIRIGELRDQGLDVADELLVEMPGPWNGPVRVVHRAPGCLHLVTLRGHMEAGQVHFRARDEDDLLTFEIELWACPASRLVHLLYSRLRLAKEIQLNMWVRFCLSAAAISGGRPVDGVHISTRRLQSPGRTLAPPASGTRRAP